MTGGSGAPTDRRGESKTSPPSPKTGGEEAVFPPVPTLSLLKGRPGRRRRSDPAAVAPPVTTLSTAGARSGAGPGDEKPPRAPRVRRDGDPEARRT